MNGAGPRHATARGARAVGTSIGPPALQAGPGRDPKWSPAKNECSTLITGKASWAVDVQACCRHQKAHAICAGAQVSTRTSALPSGATPACCPGSAGAWSVQSRNCTGNAGGPAGFAAMASLPLHPAAFWKLGSRQASMPGGTFRRGVLVAHVCDSLAAASSHPPPWGVFSHDSTAQCCRQPPRHNIHESQKGQRCQRHAHWAGACRAGRPPVGRVPGPDACASGGTRPGPRTGA